MSLSRFSVISLLLSLFLLIGGVDAYGMTPQQKRERAKEIRLRKKEAAKRKAERKKAAKLKAAKRKRIKEGKPLMYVYAYDLRTGDPLAGTYITVQDVNARPGRKPKLYKATDAKRFRVSKQLPVGQYWVAASRLGYFPADTIFFRHQEDEDTVRVALYPESRLTFTVTDSLTGRPVAANIIVRTNEQKRVLQTTSDSVHSLIAVLLDDRVPFYTVSATAANYFPFHDTIYNVIQYEGIVMSPNEVKSFVLHNIYFATGKTTILDSSEPALAELHQFLALRPNQRIRIVGHTDDIGSDRSNQILSEGRCEEVRRAMIDRGISPDRIEIEGRGERDPIVPNDNDEHRQMNRRVEIVLL